jgi:hypothetical protein
LTVAAHGCWPELVLRYRYPPRVEVEEYVNAAADARGHVREAPRAAGFAGGAV